MIALVIFTIPITNNIIFHVYTEQWKTQKIMAYMGRMNRWSYEAS